MSVLQEKLNFLLEKYAVAKTAVLSEEHTSVTVDGASYPLLPWREERRFIELRKIVDTTVGNISHFKTMSLNPRDAALDDIILRELDTAEYIGGFAVTEIFMAENGPTCSVLCMTDKKAVLTLELDATLETGRPVIDKHEIITDRGTACDRNVDSQTPLSSTYVFGKTTEEYTDVDFELFGLSIYEISVVRQAFAVAKGASYGEALTAARKRLDGLVLKAHQSADECRNVIL